MNLSEEDTDPVIVVGAGPVGMTAALHLARFGVPSLLLEAEEHRSVAGSRSICVQGDMLDVLERVGVGWAVVEAGVTWYSGRIFYQDQEVVRLQLPKPRPGWFPPFVNTPQTVVETLLAERVAATPLIDLRRGHRVTALTQDDRGVTVTAAGNTYRGTHCIAADGPRSTVRGLLGLPFQGRSYADKFLITDIRANLNMTTPERLFYFDPAWNPGRQVLLHPQPHSTWRIDWQVPDDFDLATERATGGLDHRIRAVIGDIDYEIIWSSSYRFHQRRVPTMTVSRVLLAGDAAHLMSPFGARGLNSGLADAENAAWKIAALRQHWCAPTPTPERSPAAAENRHVTDDPESFAPTAESHYVASEQEGSAATAGNHRVTHEPESYPAVAGNPRVANDLERSAAVVGNRRPLDDTDRSAAVAENLLASSDTDRSAEAAENLLASYNIERSAAAAENLRVTDETMRFLVPATPADHAHRTTILTRSRTDPTARPHINSGRLAEPYWYLDSPLTTPASAEARANFPTTPGTPRPPLPGVLCPDLSIPSGAVPASTRLRAVLGPAFTVLLAPDARLPEHLTPTTPAASTPATQTPKTGAAPTDTPPCATTRTPDLTILRLDDATAEALALPANGAAVVRPDGYLAAVLASADDVAEAIARATGHRVPP